MRTSLFQVRVLSSVGRASPLQGECQRFDPVSTHHKKAAIRDVVPVLGVVVQLVRIPACHAGGRGFEPRPLRQKSKALSEMTRLLFYASRKNQTIFVDFLNTFKIAAPIMMYSTINSR